MIIHENVNKNQIKWKKRINEKKRAYEYDYGVVPMKNWLSSSVIPRCHYNFVINIYNKI